MTDTIARLRSGKLTFETMVDLDAAMKLKKGENVVMTDVVRDTAIYTDIKKGMHAGKAELDQVFGTVEVFEVAKKIILKGTIEVTQEFRDEAVEGKRKQIVDFLIRNAIDARTGRPYTPDIIENALRESGVRIDARPIDQQIPSVLETLKKTLPITIETKRIKITIPAQHTGKGYGLLSEYKEKEEWLSNGDLVAFLAIPVGVIPDFYDKLNAITHGSALTEEIKE
jgi:ribosome maturation protein SDO1